MKTHRILWTALAVALLLPLLAVADAQAQRVEIMVLDLGLQQRVGSVGPGETFRMAPGETLRFRMTVVRGGSEHFPSARFQVVGGAQNVRADAVNANVGNITVTAIDRGRADVRYEIFDREHDIPAALRTGVFAIEVVPGNRRSIDRRAVDRGRNETGRPNFEVVTLYEHQDFRGRSEAFGVGELRNLEGSHIRQDVASSLRIRPGCQVTLYEHAAFGGRSVTLGEDVTDLNRVRLNDSVSSMRIDCRGNDGFRPDRPGRGSVTIYEHQNFRGDSETFAAGRIAFMSDTQVGNDRASSVRIEGPCQITLFEHQEFRGRSTTFTRDVTDLSGTGVGNDTASSFIIECR